MYSLLYRTWLFEQPYLRLLGQDWFIQSHCHTIALFDYEGAYLVLLFPLVTCKSTSPRLLDDPLIATVTSNHGWWSVLLTVTLTLVQGCWTDPLIAAVTSVQDCWTVSLTVTVTSVQGCWSIPLITTDISQGLLIHLSDCMVHVPPTLPLIWKSLSLHSHAISSLSNNNVQ